MAHPIVHRAKHVVRNYFLHILFSTAVLTSGLLLVYAGTQAAGPILFLDSFGYATGLVTNEFAYWNAGNASAKTNASWELTSGSLFAQNGTGWSGAPDDVSPNATSSNGTNSAIFRLNTKRFDFGDVKVSLRLLNNSLTTTGSTPAVDWDGIHIFLRYQSQYNLYYASVNRRDGHVVIKKKCVGGSDNGGTYFELGSELPNHFIPFGSWQNVAASVQNGSGNTVIIKLYREGVELQSVTDSGVGCATIRNAGATGIRGDNDNFLFDDFTVESLNASATPTPTPTPAGGSGGTGGTGGTSGSSGGSGGAATPTPTATATPKTTASPKPGATSDTGQPAPLSAAALTKAARTQPTFWAGALAAALAGILAALIVRDHLHVRAHRRARAARPPRRRR
jgi:hypothetical protein